MVPRGFRPVAVAQDVRESLHNTLAGVADLPCHRLRFRLCQGLREALDAATLLREASRYGDRQVVERSPSGVQICDVLEPQRAHLDANRRLRPVPRPRKLCSYPPYRLKLNPLHAISVVPHGEHPFPEIDDQIISATAVLGSPRGVLKR